MTRLIDADALYNGAMKDEYFRFKETDKTGREAFAYSCAMERLVEAPTVGGWISVKDRLPESGVHVILCCEIHSLYNFGVAHKQYICDGYYAAPHSIADCYDSDNFDAYDYDEEEDNYYLKEGWYEVIHNWDDYSSVIIGDFVTHWMPLPEPPKEDKEYAGQ